MLQQWFYGRGSDISGPVTGRKLAEMASEGFIQASDIIWRDGVVNGVRADQVKNLFSAAAMASHQKEAPADGDSSIEFETEALGEQPTLELIPESDETASTGYLKQEKKKARAVAGKGVVLMGQDGLTVRFKVKCTVCGKEESGWKTMVIPRGTARVSFYCSKCRKKREGFLDGFH